MTITQPPGDGNALGRVRFNFNNRFSVFQHDTPDKSLFGHEVRAYSHGCMRVQDPAKYAEVLLNIARPNEHWTAEKIKRMYGGSEQNLQIQPIPIWVHLTYQTAFIDNAGKLQMRRDIYNLDSRTLAAIKSERGTVEPGAERKRDSQVCSSRAHCRSVDDVFGADLCSAAYVATNLPLISCYNTEALLQQNESDHGRLAACERVNLSAIPNFELSLQKTRASAGACTGLLQHMAAFARGVR